MKQYITIEQINELSEKGKDKLRKWWKPEYGDLIIYKGVNSWRIDKANNTVSYIKYDGKEKYLLSPSIGQMIEFLGDSVETSRQPIMIPSSDNEGSSWRVIVNNKSYYNSILCDGLWEAVKIILDN